MSRSTELRSFARAAELAAGLMPRLARAKVMSGGEAELLARQLRTGAETALDVAVGMERVDPSAGYLTLVPCQSLALRRMIDALKADDSIYSACPDVVRGAIADFLMPPYTSAETQVAAAEAQATKALGLLEKFERRALSHPNGTET